ncbi:N-acetyltransferase family protein [Glaciecola sp. 1036]|uniref:GNAT family N-acetyltransferase n=1 Tax=Alteromonadaceae TaxID=72275 RepID=UPI003CFE0334
MENITIRDAVIDDTGTILHFIKELAIFEKAEDQVEATEDMIQEAVFSENSTVFALICESGSTPVGFAIYFHNYSTWQGKHGLYLEDLYVSPEYRGSGAGKALLKQLAKIAVEKGCGRFEWSVLDWNTPAIDFYESIGAVPKSEWIGYQLAGDALTSFAKG